MRPTRVWRALSPPGPLREHRLETGMLIADALEGWYLALRASGAAPGTVQRYTRSWTRFSAFLATEGVTEVEQLQARHAQTFLLDHLTNLAPVSRHYYVTPLRSFLSWLVEVELLDRNPFRTVHGTKLEQVEIKVLRQSEAKRLLAVFELKQPDEFRDSVMVRLALDTGLRRGEVLGALLENLDRENQSLLVLGKGKKWRRVPLTAEMTLLLWRYCATARKRYAKSPALFVSRRGGPLEEHFFSRRFQGYVQRANIPHRVRFHDLRHTAATWMLMNGMPRERVARILGHSDTRTTDIYLHLEFEDIAKVYREANPLRLVK